MGFDNDIVPLNSSLYGPVQIDLRLCMDSDGAYVSIFSLLFNNLCVFRFRTNNFLVILLSSHTGTSILRALCHLCNCHIKIVRKQYKRVMVKEFKNKNLAVVYMHVM